MDITAHKGGEVNYHDPYIPSVRTGEGREFSSIELTEELLKSSDVVVLTTNHKVLDIDFIQQNSRLVVDLRNMIADKNENVFKL